MEWMALLVAMALAALTVFQVNRANKEQRETEDRRVRKAIRDWADGMGQMESEYRASEAHRAIAARRAKSS